MTLVSHFFRLLTLILLTLLFATAAADKDDSPIRLQLKWKHTFQFAGYYAALEKGYYQNAGLNVEIRELPQGDATQMDILLAGEADYAVTGADALYFRGQGEPIVALAAIFQHSPYVFLVKESSGINRMEDLRGKRIEVNSGRQHADLNAALRRVGVMPGDAEMVTSTFDLDTLIKGKVDAFSAYSTDQGHQLTEMGIAYKYLTPKTYGIDFYGDVLVTTEAEIAHNPERVEKFREASILGWRYAMEHPEEIIDIILAKYNTQNLSRSHLQYEAAASRELIQPLLVDVGHMNPARWEHIHSVFVELGYLDGTINLEGFLYRYHTPYRGLYWWIASNRGWLAGAAVSLFIFALLLTLSQMKRLVAKRTSQLAESERYARTLLATQPACVKTLDLQGRLIDMNASGLKMIGADSLDQLRGGELAGLVDESYRKQFNKILAQVLSGQSASLLFSATGLKGRKIWLDSHMTPLRDSTGKITSMIGVTTDVTDRIQAEEEKDRLEHELQQRHKMEALGQLSGGIAHDFNNILGIILGYAGLARDTCMLDGTNALLLPYLDKILQAGDRAKALVAQMLTFSRRNTAKTEVYRLQDLLREDFPLVKSSLSSAIEVSLDIDEQTPPVRIDKVQFNQLLMNLAINARDAMQGVGKLTISLKPITPLNTQADGSKDLWAELCVQDTGAGIPQHILDRIFEPFFTTKGIGQGTGMGLAVVHGIVERAGGQITVESRMGEGSCFKLDFPPAALAQATPNHQEPGKASSGKGQNILVVDDEPELAAYMGQLLTGASYKARVFTNSKEALAAFQAEPQRWEAIVSDQTMPEMTGLELVGNCRAIRPEVPVVLCSGYTEQIENLVAAMAGVKLLAKPAQPADILSALASALSTSTD